MQIDAESATKMFDKSDDRIAVDWQTHLPGKVVPAKRVSHLPDEDGITRHVKERQPLEVHILGFDDNRVHVVLGRQVGSHLWHRYHAVEADLMVERSDKVDDLLDLKAFCVPFTRTVKSIGHGDTREDVHRTLGPPDARRTTQAVGLSWDYYFDEDITIEYKGSVFEIMDDVPDAIRERTT
ncbi:MAG: hypothetical protein ACE5GE_15135, partial [Phycisphaerae bacterium]